jgi:SOS response regulatory protein OraA/RecX
MPTVNRISNQRGGRSFIELENGDRIECPTAVLGQLDVEEGDAVELEPFRQSIREISHATLEEKARKYLARYGKTTGGFVEHFTRKGYPEEMVSSLVPQLKEEGFLDDDRVAREHIRSRKRNKPRGKKKLVAELMDKGLEKSTARSIVDEEVPREEERRMAREYCEKNDGLSRQKLARRLSSRGFPSHLIHDLLDEFATGENI